MNFFDDCDLILKIHYDHFFKGPLDEDKQAIWTKLDMFYKICEQNLTTKEYGYVQAIHYQLTSDGHLVPIGDLNDLTYKTHRVTAKGYAFVLNGAYKQQVKSENEKIKHNRINSYNGTIAWILVALFSTFQSFQGCQNNQKDDEIKALKLKISQFQLKGSNPYKKCQSDTVQQQNPKRKALGKFP
jgi:hypothetical protein